MQEWLSKLLQFVQEMNYDLRHEFLQVGKQ